MKYFLSLLVILGSIFSIAACESKPAEENEGTEAFDEPEEKTEEGGEDDEILENEQVL